MPIMAHHAALPSTGAIASIASRAGASAPPYARGTMSLKMPAATNVVRIAGFLLVRIVRRDPLVVRGVLLVLVAALSAVRLLYSAAASSSSLLYLGSVSPSSLSRWAAPEPYTLSGPPRGAARGLPRSTAFHTRFPHPVIVTRCWCKLACRNPPRRVRHLYAIQAQVGIRAWLNENPCRGTADRPGRAAGPGRPAD